MSTQTQKRPVSEIIPVDRINQDLDKGVLKLQKLASEFNVDPVALKKYLVDLFGDKIVFKRGRHGGAYRVVEGS